MRSETIQAWYERWHWAIYVVVLVVALPAPYFLRLRNDNAIEAWLGDRDPAVAQYRSFQHEFGSSEFVLLALDGCRPDDPRLEPLAERIDRIHGTLPCWTPERVGARLGPFQRSLAAGFRCAAHRKAPGVHGPLRAACRRRQRLIVRGFLRASNERPRKSVSPPPNCTGADRR